MKAILIFLSLLIAFLATGRALDIVTPDGTFKDVKVTKVETEAVRITHSEGTALVDFDLLPPAMQAEYGWTPEKSAARKAAKEAEAKRIADEEKMIEEAPKRKAMEEEAKKKAEEERVAAEERAKRKAQNAEFETQNAETEKEQLAASAAARAALDRERRGGKDKADEVPVAAVLGNSVKEISEVPAPRRNVITPAFGTVSDVLGTENPFFHNRKVWIGIGVGLVVVLILFMLPSSSPKKVRRR
jgi:flagellar biosynthesis GTPase FlhF